MQQAKVTFKGQITIPKAVREALDIREGDSVTFMVEENHAVLKPLKKKNLLDFYGAFPTKRPYPGLETVRKEVHNKIAERFAGRKKP
jgi:AbrB family looped-hinge helix DNA binding protein